MNNITSSWIPHNMYSFQTIMFHLCSLHYIFSFYWFCFHFHHGCLVELEAFLPQLVYLLSFSTRDMLQTADVHKYFATQIIIIVEDIIYGYSNTGKLELCKIIFCSQGGWLGRSQGVQTWYLNSKLASSGRLSNKIQYLDEPKFSHNACSNLKIIKIN